MILKGCGKKEVIPTFSTMPHVDSGSLIINSIVGGSMASDGRGQVCPGYPRRKIVEIYGPESSGKTTIALSSAVEVQRAGGSVMFLDFEHSLHHGYAQKIGIKFDDTFMHFQPDTMEEGLKMIYIAISQGVDLIIVDSVAAMVPEAEMGKKLDETAKVGAVAKKMAETLPKICTWLATHPKIGTGETKKTDTTRLGSALILLNQERAMISTGGHGGDTTNTSGGKAVKFYASLRLRFVRIGSEVIERKDRLTGKTKKFPYGNKTLVKVVKNKLDGTQGQSGEFFIRYGFGLDNYYSVIETGAANGVLKKDGAYYAYNEHRIQGRDKFRAFLIENQKIYSEICKNLSVVLGAGGTAIGDDELSAEDELLSELETEIGGGDDEEAGESVVDADDAVLGDDEDDASSDDAE